jgi:uncharacterized membrane protein
MAVSEKIHDLIHRLLDVRLDDLTPEERKGFVTAAKTLLVSRDVAADYDAGKTFGDRLADKVASFGGSWTFIIIFGAILGIWVIANTVILVSGRAFDPYPFIFLNLILSMLAAVQAPIIMMSQNRQAVRDRLAAANDYDVNVKAEIEIMALHEKLDRLRLDDLTRIVEAQADEIKVLRLLIEAKPKARKGRAGAADPQ